MDNRILISVLVGSVALMSACVNVDESVAQKPSMYWKAPKDAVSEREIAPENITTDGIREDTSKKNADAKAKVDVKKMSLSAAEKLELGQFLDLSELVDIALENNTSTRVYWFQAKAYAAKLGKANSSYYPQISVGAQVYRSRTTPSIQYFPSIGRYYETGYGPSAEINWLLCDFGKREAQVQAAREALRAANFDYNQTLQDVVLSVNVAYYNLYAALGGVRAATMAIEDATASYKSADARLKNGVGKTQDALNALANLRNKEYAYQKAISQVETARAQLASVLGIRVSEKLKISQDVTLPTSEATNGRIDELIAKALRSRQSVLSAYAKLRQTEASEKIAKRDFLPKIGAYGQAAYMEYSDDKRGAQQQYTVGAQLEWSIFEGFARKYELINARATKRVQEQNLKAEEISIISDIWKYYHSYQSALKQVASMKAVVEANEQAYEATRIGYENSINSITDLLNAQNSLSLAREESVVANSNLAISIAQLAHATGALTSSIPDDTDLAEIPQK